MKIELVDDYETRPKKNYSSPRVVYPNLKAAANQQIRELLEARIIEECKESTVHCSMGQFIPKKTPGKTRLVIDYRSVNDCIKRPQWPMLSSTEIRNSIPDEWKVFWTADLTSGYYQIPLDEESKQLTAFIVPQGKFRFTVSPMGLKPSGDYFGMNTKSLCEGKNEGNPKSVDHTLREPEIQEN